MSELTREQKMTFCKDGVPFFVNGVTKRQLESLSLGNIVFAREEG